MVHLALWIVSAFIVILVSWTILAWLSAGIAYIFFKLKGEEL
jgi:hypothetical protein